MHKPMAFSILSDFLVKVAVYKKLPSALVMYKPFAGLSIALTSNQLEKYSNKLSMKALVGKSMLMKNKKKRGTSFNTPFFHIYFLATQGNSRELRGT